MSLVVCVVGVDARKMDLSDDVAFGQIFWKEHGAWGGTCSVSFPFHELGRRHIHTHQSIFKVEGCDHWQGRMLVQTVGLLSSRSLLIGMAVT